MCDGNVIIVCIGSKKRLEQLGSENQSPLFRMPSVRTEEHPCLQAHCVRDWTTQLGTTVSAHM